MTPLRVGIVGCGRFAQYYHVPTLLEDERMRLSAIFDPAPSDDLIPLAKANAIALVPSLDELLAPGRVDAVLVSSPHALHAEHVRAVLAAGRPILVDKPFVLTAEEARASAATAAGARLVAGVAFNRRLDPGCLHASKLLASGAIGPLRHVETIQLGYPKSGWLTDPKLGGGGPFVGRGAHMADLIPWLTGQRPRSVVAQTRPGHPGRVDRGGWIDLDFEAFTCRMTCLDDGLDLWDEVRLFGDEGFIELRRPMGYPIGWELVRLDKNGLEAERINADPATGACTKDFVAAIRDCTPIACSFADAYASVRIIEAAYQSAARGGGRVALDL